MERKGTVEDVLAVLERTRDGSSSDAVEADDSVRSSPSHSSANEPVIDVEMTSPPRQARVGAHLADRVEQHVFGSPLPLKHPAPNRPGLVIPINPPGPGSVPAGDTMPMKAILSPPSPGTHTTNDTFPANGRKGSKTLDAGSAFGNVHPLAEYADFKYEEEERDEDRLTMGMPPSRIGSDDNAVFKKAIRWWMRARRRRRQQFFAAAEFGLLLPLT